MSMSARYNYRYWISDFFCFRVNNEKKSLRWDATKGGWTGSLERWSRKQWPWLELGRSVPRYREKENETYTRVYSMRSSTAELRPTHHPALALYRTPCMYRVYCLLLSRRDWPRSSIAGLHKNARTHTRRHLRYMEICLLCNGLIFKSFFFIIVYPLQNYFFSL